MAGAGSRIRSRLPLILRALALALLVLAAARPQFYNVSRETKTSGVDILLCLDTSGTMRAMDFTIGGDAVDRLTAVKKVVKEFIVKRERDRIGLVIFGDEAFTQCPLTLDKGLLLKPRGQAGGRDGRRPDGHRRRRRAGRQALKDIKAKARILVLLTDGRHNAGDITPLQAAAAVRALGIKVYTIGVGGKGRRRSRSTRCSAAPGVPGGRPRRGDADQGRAAGRREVLQGRGQQAARRDLRHHRPRGEI